jgi:hypothetical protein
MFISLDDNYRHPVEEKRIRFKKNITKGTKKSNVVWISLITVISFTASAVLSVVSSDLLKRVDLSISFLVLLIIITVNIISDIVGTAVTAADETPFHAMASRKVFGAKRAIMLIRNADKVSNVCNDVIGDICGVISGAAGAYIALRIMSGSGTDSGIELIITGCIAAFTVGGKALGKMLGIQNSNFIIYRVSVIIQFIAGNPERKNNKKKRSKKQKNED